MRSVENHVPAADCATVRRHAAGIVTLKTEIAFAAQQFPETSMKRSEQDCCTRHVFTPEIQKVQISCEIMIDGWHDRLMIPSRLRTDEHGISQQLVQAWEPAGRITIMRWSNRGRLEPSTTRQARTLPLVFPSVICNLVTLLFF